MALFFYSLASIGHVLHPGTWGRLAELEGDIGSWVLMTRQGGGRDVIELLDCFVWVLIS